MNKGQSSYSLQSLLFSYYDGWIGCRYGCYSRGDVKRCYFYYEIRDWDRFYKQTNKQSNHIGVLEVKIPNEIIKIESYCLHICPIFSF